MQRQRKLAAVRRALNDDGFIKGDEASFFCTYSKGCAGKHHKRKLAINFEHDYFHCWVCGWKGGSLLPILRRLGERDPDYVDYAKEHEGKPKTEVARLYDKPRLPADFLPLSRPSTSLQHKQAIAYLTRRGVTQEDILDYKMGVCTDGRYSDRIIIPSFDEFGELNFFVGRTMWDRPGDLPYLSGKFDKDIVFNDLLVDWSKPVTLVEGPFDAIKAGHNAIALQGKLPSTRLLSKINAFKPKVYVALDSDATEEAVHIAELLVVMGVNSYIINWPKGVKDAGELTKKQFKFLLDYAKPVSNDFDVMRQKVYNSGSLGHS